jgi:hypothetical protein
MIVIVLKIIKLLAYIILYKCLCLPGLTTVAHLTGLSVMNKKVL